MKYDNVFKLKCVKEYEKGNWIAPPKGINAINFKKMLRK